MRLLLVVPHLTAIHLLLVPAAPKLARLERLARLGVLLADDGEEVLSEFNALVDLRLVGAAVRPARTYHQRTHRKTSESRDDRHLKTHAIEICSGSSPSLPVSVSM